MRQCGLVFCLLWSSLACISATAQEPESGLDHTLFRLPYPAGFVVTPDLTQLILSLPESAELLYFDSINEKLTRKLEMEFQPGTMALRDESLFVAGAGSSVIYELNWKTGKVIRQISIPGDGISHLAVHPKRPLVFASTNDLEVFVVDLGEAKAYKTKASGDHLAVSPDGESLYAGMQPRSPDGVLLIRETPDGTIRFIFDDWGVRATLAKYKISGHNLTLVSSQANASVNGYAMHLSPDGKRLMLPGGGGWRPPAVGGTGGGYVIAVFDANNLTAKLGQAPHGEAIIYHPILNMAAISGLGHNLVLCDGKSFKERQKIEFSKGGHGGRQVLAFVGKGTKIALYNGANPKADDEGLHFFDLELTKEERAQLTKTYGPLPKPVHQKAAALPKSEAKPKAVAKSNASKNNATKNDVPAKTTEKPKTSETVKQRLFKSTVLELTDKAPADWIFKEAKVGALLQPDREYSFTALPKEIVGGTIVWRSGLAGWLNPAAVRASVPCTAYAIMRTREHGKGQLDDVTLTKFIREGWEEVEGPVKTNVDTAFDTEWIALKKTVPAGEVVLQLDTINFGNGAAIFAFKADANAAKSAGASANPTTKSGSRTKALFRSDIVEFTDKASPNWIFKEAKVGALLQPDREYSFTALPKEIVGGTIVWRSDLVGWLNPAAVRASAPCTAYAIMRTREHGKGQLDDVTLTKFIREGWEEVEGPVKTNVDTAFDTEWIALKKTVPAGEVVLQLDTINFGNGAAIFAFKTDANTAKSAGASANPTTKSGSRTKALFRSDIVEFTDKASPNWIFKEAKVGTEVWSANHYFLTAVPPEMIGGSLVLRDSGDLQWLPSGTINAIEDCSVYVMLRTKSLGKVELNEEVFVKLANEGWKEVEGKANVNFPNGENWQWKVFKKSVSKGPVAIPLQTLKWQRNTALFIFKKP